VAHLPGLTGPGMPLRETGSGRRIDAVLTNWRKVIRIGHSVTPTWQRRLLGSERHQPGYRPNQGSVEVRTRSSSRLLLR
jgi:hypothetical protein